MRHVKQKDGAGTCGAVAYAAILELSELQGIRECKTIMRGKRKGTSAYNVQDAFSKRGIDSHAVDTGHVRLHDVFWIEPLSHHFPIYASTSQRKNRTQHAVAIMGGQVFDGHYDHPLPLDLYPQVWLEHVLVVDKELPSWGKQ